VIQVLLKFRKIHSRVLDKGSGAMQRLLFERKEFDRQLKRTPQQRCIWGQQDRSVRCYLLPRCSWIAIIFLAFVIGSLPAEAAGTGAVTLAWDANTQPQLDISRLAIRRLCLWQMIC
jgi:hypothetical protein